MKVQPAAFLRTTLPLGIDMLEQYDSGRYHSIWLPDHMVSFWPDSIWTPEFTDLATVSPSPHRHLDGMAVAAAAAVLTKNVPIVTTRGRHRASTSRDAGADGADHRPPVAGALHPGPRLAARLENTVPYGFDFDKPVSPLRGGAQGHPAAVGQRRTGRLRRPVLSPGACAAGHRARTTGRVPPIWIGASGPRMLRHRRALRRRLVARRRVHAGGLRGKARGRPRVGRAGRPRPDGDRPVLSPRSASSATTTRSRRCSTPRWSRRSSCCSTGRGPAQASATSTRWGRLARSSMDIDPATLTREQIVDVLRPVDTQAILDDRPVRYAQSRWRTSDQGVSCDAGTAGLQDLGLRRHGRAGVRRRAPRPRCARPRTNCCTLCGGERHERQGTCSTPPRCSPRRRPTRACPTGATPRCPSASPSRSIISTASAWTPTGSQQAATVCHWLLTSRLEFFEDRDRYPIADEVIERADVRDRRAALGYHADARADVGRSRCAGAAVLGGDVPVAAARCGRPPTIRAATAPTPTGARSTPRCRSGCTSHPYNDMLGDGLPEDERTWAFDFRVMTPTAWWRVPMQTLVAGSADRCRRAVPHSQDDAAAVPVQPAAEVLGAQGLPRLSAARSSSTPIPMPNSSGCTAIRCRSRRRAR